MSRNKNKKQNKPLETNEEAGIPTTETTEVSTDVVEETQEKHADESEVSDSESDSVESSETTEESEPEIPEDKTPEPKETNEEAVAFVPLDEKKTYKILVTKTACGLKKGKEHTVSGNVANILIKKGIAKAL